MSRYLSGWRSTACLWAFRASRPHSLSIRGRLGAPSCWAAAGLLLTQPGSWARRRLRKAWKRRSPARRMGGSNSNEGAFWGSLAADTAGHVCLAADKQSSDFPATSNACQKPFPLSDGCDVTTEPHPVGALTDFCPDRTQMVYSTEIGGKTEALGGGKPVCNQCPLSIYLDAQGNISLNGTTGMSDFPVTSYAVSRSLNTNGKQGRAPANAHHGQGDGVFRLGGEPCHRHRAHRAVTGEQRDTIASSEFSRALEDRRKSKGAESHPRRHSFMRREKDGSQGLPCLRESYAARIERGQASAK